MTKIQILGAGCPNCKKLHEMVLHAVKELNLECEVEYLIGDVGTSKIIELGIMTSPVLVLNGKPIMVGFVPDVEKIKGLIVNAK